MMPSSIFLAKKMLAPIDFNKTICVVEFGPGTGIFTHKILEKLNKNSNLLVFEINDSFYEELKTIQDSRLTLIHDSAEKINFYLEKLNLKADYVLSSLPLAMIPDSVVQNILIESNTALKNSGKFIQFQYSTHSLQKVKTFFTKVSIQFTFLNIPPAFVYIGLKK